MYEGDTDQNQYHGYHLEDKEAQKDSYRWLREYFSVK